ncbi:MAG: hypothetical protein EA350_09740 [Gemmatimonadales bacterium]|nr:MAG: hypothetical protein EA350_09740 [Gemmatimonadales bacterium]
MEQGVCLGRTPRIRRASAPRDPGRAGSCGGQAGQEHDAPVGHASRIRVVNPAEGPSSRRLHTNRIQSMSKLLRGLAAGYGAKKLGGGCITTILIFIVLWMVLGNFEIFR